MPLRFKVLLATSLNLNNKGLLWLHILTQSWQYDSYSSSLLLSILCTWPSYHLHIRKQSWQKNSYFSGLLLSILCTWPRYHLHIRKQSWRKNSYFSGLLLSILSPWPSHPRMIVSSIDCSPARQRFSTFFPGYVPYHRIKVGASLYLVPIYSYDSTPYGREKWTAR